jgi:hypothetical protein
VWVCSASDPQAGDFITPATVRSGELVIAVSTGGAAPALARRVRERLQEQFDEHFAAWLALLGELRPLIAAGVPDEEQRRRLWEELTRWEWLERVRDEGRDAVRQAMRQVVEQGSTIAPATGSGHDEGSTRAHETGPCTPRDARMSENKLCTDIEPYPEPDSAVDKEALEDWSWALQERSKGRFDKYAGLHVAVVNRTALGSSRDPNLLRQYLAENCGRGGPRRMELGAAGAEQGTIRRICRPARGGRESNRAGQ